MEKHKGSVAEDYGRQTRAVVAFALFGGLTALGTVATGLWFILYVKDFVVIVEVYMRDMFCGYSALGAYLLLSVVFNIFGALCNDRRILLACLVLLLGLLVCEAGMWVFIYLQKGDISATILNNMRLYACSKCAVAYYVDKTFACSVTTATVQNSESAYIDCSSHIDQWMTVVLWAVLGFSLGRMALEGLLLTLTLMLRHLFLLTPRKNQVVPASSDMDIYTRNSADDVIEKGLTGYYASLTRHASMD